LPEKAAAEGVTPLESMRRSGAFELKQHVGAIHEEPVPEAELADLHVDPLGRVYARSPKPDQPNIVPVPTPDGDAEGRRRVGVTTGQLVRVETRIGHFVVKAWVTEGIRPGVVACSHHMGRWKTADNGQRQMMATVSLDRQGSLWKLQRERGVEPYASADVDTERIWWTDAGVHQNLTFPVQPDPIS